MTDPWTLLALAMGALLGAAAVLAWPLARDMAFRTYDAMVSPQPPEDPPESMAARLGPYESTTLSPLWQIPIPDHSAVAWPYDSTPPDPALYESTAPPMAPVYPSDDAAQAPPASGTLHADDADDPWDDPWPTGDDAEWAATWGDWADTSQAPTTGPTRPAVSRRRPLRSEVADLLRQRRSDRHDAP